MNVDPENESSEFMIVFKHQWHKGDAVGNLGKSELDRAQGAAEFMPRKDVGCL